MSILSKIQSELKVHKSQVNKFGGYSFRSLEDIQEALKPILAKHHYAVVINDSIELIGDRYYCKAVASLYDDNMKLVIYSAGFAREPLSQKGMSESQLTGTASSYARKYAMNALFAIDDTKDADTMDNSKNVPMVTAEQVKYISTLITTKEIDRDKVKQAYKVESMNDLTADNALRLIEQLKAK